MQFKKTELCQKKLLLIFVFHGFVYKEYVLDLRNNVES